jgi:hypothetical protein
MQMKMNKIALPDLKAACPEVKLSPLPDKNNWYLGTVPSPSSLPGTAYMR